MEKDFKELRDYVDSLNSPSQAAPILVALRIIEQVVKDINRIANALEKKNED